MPVVSVDIPLRKSFASYEVVIGKGRISNIQKNLPEGLNNEKAVILADDNLPAQLTDCLKKGLGAPSGEAEILVYSFKSGESAKNIETVTRLYDFMIENGLERGHPVFSLGGGVTGDIAGFVAATYLRGVPYIQVPTTLLAMVDASIGGKTGYNHPKGKNLIGAFYQPDLVVADTGALQTLSSREFRSGMAECIKHALIADWELFEWMEENISSILNLKEGALNTLIERNVRIKADIVCKDERESGARALLNLGHTYGHAIEVCCGYGHYTHGEAVAMGCIAACALAEKLDIAPSGLLERACGLIEKTGLPVKGRLPEKSELMAAMRRDKKVKSGRLRLVLPTGYGVADIFPDISSSDIQDSWDFVSQKQ